MVCYHTYHSLTHSLAHSLISHTLTLPYLSAYGPTRPYLPNPPAY